MGNFSMMFYNIITFSNMTNLCIKRNHYVLTKIETLKLYLIIQK